MNDKIQLQTRRAKKEDLQEVINMIQELADFEEMPNGPKLKINDLIRDGCYNENTETAERPLFYCFLAEIHHNKENNVEDSSITKTIVTTTNNEQTTLQPLLCKTIIGYGLCFYTYSTWEGKSLLLEDLYIKPIYRKLGAGKLLFKEIAKFANDTNCSRLDFHVLNWNPAIGFYEKLGAKNLTNLESWQFFRMDKKSITSLLTE